MTNAKLIITHGTTDLQILLRDENGRLWRAVPDKNIVRRYHEWLLERHPDAEVIAVPDELMEREREATFTDWVEDTYALWTREGSPEARPERSASGRLQLMLPKIQPALDTWIAGGEKESRTIIGALVLSTDRGSAEQEPVATFHYLKKALIERGVAESAISEQIYLRPGERLEDANNQVSRDIAERLERFVRDFYRQEPEQKAVLMIASMGGLPPIKPLLAEIAALLAGDRVMNLFKTELGALGVLSNTAIDALRARRQSLEQVRRGNLLDAYALAGPCQDDIDAVRWVRPLSQASRLLNGNPVGERAELPALSAIFRAAERASCLIVAIRVETALLTQRWLEAINGTLIFLEAAFHDALRRWAKDNLDAYDPKRRYMRFKADPPDVLLERKAIEPWKSDSQKSADPSAFRSNTVGEAALSAWDEVLNVQPLHELRYTIHTPKRLDNGSTFKLSEFRNFNTHGVMSQEEIDEAIERFMEAGLWSQGVNGAAPPTPGACFLKRPLVENVIREFVELEESPSQLYVELLRQIEARLIDPASMN